MAYGSRRPNKATQPATKRRWYGLYVALLLMATTGQLPLLAATHSESTLLAQQQEKQKTVTGTVVDSKSNPMPGVTIRIKGEKGGTTTNEKGQFKLNISGNQATLLFSYISFKPKEVKVTAGKKITVVMEEDNDLLDEVVITGFQTKSKSSFTGSSTTVSQSEMMSLGTKNILESVEAFVPGMVTLKNNALGSDPNARPELNIRGRASFEGKANMPVFVVDGSIVTAEFIFDMDMNDISSVTVLRDASATALYGAKGSAGVIVITTRPLEGGRLKLSYNGTMRASMPDLSDYHLLNAKEKLEYERLAGVFKSDTPEKQYELDRQYATLLTQIQRGVDTDWMAKPLRVGLSQNHNINVSGGDDYARYSIGMRYGKDEGVMRGSSRDRFNTTFRLSYSKSDQFFVSNLSRVSFVKSVNSPYGSFYNFTNANPYDSPYDEKGDLRPLLTLWYS